MSLEQETMLSALPGDGISSLTFAPSSNALLLTSWDSTTRLYDAELNTLRSTHTFKAACLTCCFQDNDTGFAGGIDCSIRRLDFQRGSDELVGSHQKAVRCMNYCPVYSALYTGSWDSTVGVWDVRSNSQTSSVALPAKAFSMHQTSTRLIVATGGRHVYVYDKRNMSVPEQQRESSLKCQTRCVRCFPDGTGFALSSIEGRVAVEYFDSDPQVQALKYAFKCHRSPQVAYPVNCIAYHPIFGTFATGGGDGFINIWDGGNKKRLCQLHQFPTSIADLAFNYTGSLLAIAASYTWEEGNRPHPEDNVYIRVVNEADVKPRPKA